ncbi:unnamed protein product [Hydatigera taeniaeformis]|uniref:Apobec1 complementation factor n=1 Tax=Hydatigena taeniaeformis TaxID=6205 RepID=A0A0R3X4B6_HYDTA|nr:unnamed protein product [Hydatigera taeniaeformis]
MSSCCDVNQLECGLHSLQLSLANGAASTDRPPYQISDWNMSIDAVLSQGIVSRQDNQNAAALSAEEGIAKLLNRTNYTIAKENGQRRYGPPPNWTGEIPPRGCEVFVGKIPRDCFEDELIPIFEKIGPIYMFRLMMEFNGHNRGYGFCVYTTRDDAKRAVDELNNYEIRKGKTIGVCLSVDNCRLFVGGIPKNKTKEEILVEMQKVTDGVKDVICYPSVADKTKNRGFAFVEYESHKAAAMARRKLIPGRIQPWGQQIAVDWAEPEREVNEEIMMKVKILYVRNLMLSTTEDQLRAHFLEAAGAGDQAIERVKKISDYAFIHFKDREVAQRCLEKLNGTTIDGSTVEVTWAKPADKGEPVRSQNVRSGRQLMDWNLNGEFTNTANYFLDPTTAFLAGFSPLVLPGSGCTRSNSARTGRRNAAGGRSAAAQRERKHPVELQFLELPYQTSATPIQSNGVPGAHSFVCICVCVCPCVGGCLQISSIQQFKFKHFLFFPSFSQIMEEFCQRSGLESPIYSALPVDIVDCATGGKIQLFIGQVIISSLRLRYLTPGYYNTAEEAKVGAAETAVYNLHYSQLQLAMADYANQDQSGEDNEQHVCGGLEAFENSGVMQTTSADVTPHTWSHSGYSITLSCNCSYLIIVNGTLPPTTPTGGIIPGASTTSLLPMVFPQALSNRSLPFSPLPCQSGLYAPSPGPLTPILPISTYDSSLPLQNLPIQNQILDFQSSLISNPLLPCGSVIPAGTLVVDPSAINTPTSSTAPATFGGLQSCPTTNSETLTELKQKSLVSQNNGHCGSASVNFLPSLIPGLSTPPPPPPSQPVTNVAVAAAAAAAAAATAGSLNFRLPVSPSDSILSTSQLSLNGLPGSTTVAGATMATQSLLNPLNSTVSS